MKFLLLSLFLTINYTFAQNKKVATNIVVKNVSYFQVVCSDSQKNSVNPNSPMQMAQYKLNQQLVKVNNIISVSNPSVSYPSKDSVSLCVTVVIKKTIFKEVPMNKKQLAQMNMI